MESVPIPKIADIMSSDDQECEIHFERTYSRDHAGRFFGELPFKTNNPFFPGTFFTAELTLLRTEKRFKKNQKLCDCYHAFMREYKKLSHMSEIGNENSITSTKLDESYFIPHHGIFQGNSSNAK